MKRKLVWAGLLTALVASGAWAAPAGPWSLPVKSFRLIERVSGPVNYYTVMAGPPAFLRSRYEPGYKTAVVGFDAKEGQARATRFRWKWRAVVLPHAEFRQHFEGGDASADVPDLFGIGLMSDGDQTESVSSADFAEFTLE